MMSSTQQMGVFQQPARAFFIIVQPHAVCAAGLFVLVPERDEGSNRERKVSPLTGSGPTDSDFVSADGLL
jgi:hypothetical protein